MASLSLRLVFNHQIFDPQMETHSITFSKQ